MNEIWKDIKDYEGYYQVSNFGRIKSLSHYAKTRGGGLRITNSKIIKPFLTKDGYLLVILYKDNNEKKYRVHRLVANAFIDNIYNLPQVDHINTIRTDNRVENLRWADGDIQMNNPITKEHLKTAMIGKHINRKDQSKPVIQYTLDMMFVAEYSSIGEANRQTGISKSGISNCCHGNSRYSYAGGYIWKFKL